MTLPLMPSTLAAPTATETVNCVVIGAGVVGLAVARALASKGREVVVLEAAGAIGTGTSSRNSEVIHAGMYYPKDSLKARLCVAGNRLIRDYCADHGVPFRMTGKLIVATDEAEALALKGIAAKGEANGVADLRWIDGDEARAMEPNVRCVAALISPSTGIIDSHAYMLSLRGEAEAHGASVALNTPAVAGAATNDGVTLLTGGTDAMALKCRTVVNCGGLGAQAISGAMAGIVPSSVPRRFLCKGNYFTMAGKMPFSRLVYPVPVGAGLGVHYTLDLAGQGRFGPDVEWVESEDYQVNPARAASFYGAIRRYWPDLADGALVPAYAGIRPKVQGPDDAARDFVIHGPRDHGVPGYVALYGIESPGLTASLAIADLVAEMAA